MTNVTTLRVLTKKSKLGFGRYHDWTVADMLIRKPSYIAWAYYCVPGISFCEEILKELHIEDRIEKPGKDEAAFREYQKAVTKTFRARPSLLAGREGPEAQGEGCAGKRDSKDLVHER